MKTIKLLLATILFMGCTCVWADSKPLSEMSDKELSAYYEQTINELNAEIKLINTKMKADKDNVDLHRQLNTCKADLKTAKANKKIVDNAIKIRNKADKAIEKADKAIEKANKLKKEAEELAEKADKAARQTLKLRQN